MAETEESDAQGRKGVRETWDSRRSFERHSITLQAAPLGVNASKPCGQCKGMILWRLIISQTHMLGYMMLQEPMLLLQHMKQCAGCRGADGLILVVQRFLEQGNNPMISDIPRERRATILGPGISGPGRGSAARFANTSITPVTFAFVALPIAKVADDHAAVSFCQVALSLSPYHHECLITFTHDAVCAIISA